MSIHIPIELRVIGNNSEPSVISTFPDPDTIRKLQLDLGRRIRNKDKAVISIPKFLDEPKNAIYYQTLLFENISWGQFKRLTTLTLSVKLHNTYRILHNSTPHLNHILSGIQFMNTSRMYEWIKHDNLEDIVSLSGAMKCYQLENGTRYLLLSTYADMYYLAVWSSSSKNNQYKFTVLVEYRHSLWDEVRTKHLDMFEPGKTVNLINPRKHIDFNDNKLNRPKSAAM